VKSSGYNAEFGAATGGVISAITKSGSNRIRGSAGTYFDSDSMRGEPRKNWRINPYTDAGGNFPGEKEEVVTSTNPWTQWDPVFDVGGPIAKDKIWYWAGLSMTRTDQSREATFWNATNRGYNRDYNRTFDWFSETRYLQWNATSQLSNNVRFRASGANQWGKSRGTAPTVEPNGGLTNLPGVLTDGFTRATWPSLTAWTGNIDDYMDLMYGEERLEHLEPHVLRNVGLGGVAIVLRERDRRHSVVRHVPAGRVRG
jgi:hypothetical protein